VAARQSRAAPSVEARPAFALVEERQSCAEPSQAPFRPKPRAFVCSPRRRCANVAALG
jgi:hypothetical protein